MNCRNKIKRQDLFGYQVKLNFHDSSYNSLFGGIISILLKVFVTIYALINFGFLIFQNNSINLSVLENYQNNNINIKYGETRVTIFHVIKKQIGNKPLFLN